jgi:hypothetical protein
LGGYCFRGRLRPRWGGALAASPPWLLTRWWQTIGGQQCDRGQLFPCCSNGSVGVLFRR